MKLRRVRLCNFQSFGPEPTLIDMTDLVFLIGPNGSGKTAAMQALCRMFAFDSTLRRIKRSDFHIPINEAQMPESRTLWIEADYLFPELEDDDGDHPTIPVHFSHMRLDTPEEGAYVRFRLEAQMDSDGEIDESINYVLAVDAEGKPTNVAKVSRAERNNIHVHYLPARRDPADHITFSANALLGRLLRAVNWEKERASINDLTEQISENLSGNESIAALTESLSGTWKGLHRGKFFSDPSITFVASEIDSLLRHMSVSFTPGHDDQLVDFTRLSDGQKSILYLSLVLCSQAIGRAVLKNENDSFDPIKLKPAIFTLIALEEPENSLSPHYLGRIVTALKTLVKGEDAQAIIATHSPSMLRRVDPENIRYLRLNSNRRTQVNLIEMPQVEDDAHKFVREAVLAFPELYFSRLVILGEGDSEEIVLPRLLQAKGFPVDEYAISIAPLGGRHVNHFWRLLSALEIPYVTLLDLDVARYQGGWGRLKYANDQLKKYSNVGQLRDDYGIPNWDSDTHMILDFPHYLQEFETKDIFFSAPLDLDFSMIKKFPDAYTVKPTIPDDETIKAVLGKKAHRADQYDEEEGKLFRTYHKRFKLGSKPAAHIAALSTLDDASLDWDTPDELERLIGAVSAKLKDIPE